MPTFTYLALNQKQESITGTLDATDRGRALAILAGQRLRPISVSEDANAIKKRNRKALLGKRVKSDDVVMFTRQLSAMISAGVPILRALDSLGSHAENPTFKRTIELMMKDIQGGMPFADAIEKHPNIFSDVYSNMVRAGEAAGILDDILKRLALQQEKNASIRKKVKSAMTYPMVLLGITVLAFFGLMIFVIPMIGNTIKDLAGEDAELPMITQIMLGFSNFILGWWFIILPLLFGAVYMLLRYIKTPTGKRNFHIAILKIPAIKSIVRKLAVARFARTFSALIGAGVAVLEALDVTARAIGNTVYEESLRDAAERVKNGETLSAVITEKEVLFPPIVAQMLSVGEETGQTEKVLVKVADFYEEEVDAAIDGLSSIIEPVMIVIMGGGVGLIAASVMMPITGLTNQIQ
ncbi:type II secretion system F family protein [Candidatus Saccharibacteria bacterium]|nr:type II secretion system F family protein [Candidatus Saccharibacteria bacterium]